MIAWQAEGRFKVQADEQGVPCIDVNEFRLLAHSDDAPQAALEAFVANVLRFETYEQDGTNQVLLAEIADRLASYRQHIQLLREIHTKHYSHVDVLRDESPVAAAYILYSKVIRLLSMACHLLENSFIDAIAVLRLIHEAIQLATYFMLADKLDEAKEHARVWFRENHSPPNAICRRATAAHLADTLQISQDVIERIMTDLYSGQSRPIHHTYRGIIETYRAKTAPQGIVPLGFDYDRCSIPWKVLEPVRFFQSSILSAVQGFVFCFHSSLPLADGEIEQLMSLERSLRE